VLEKFSCGFQTRNCRLRQVSRNGTARSKAERLSWAERIGKGPERIREKLVDASSALPVDDVDQVPGILIELKLKLPLFVHC
jgi:hypothetical protein